MSDPVERVTILLGRTGENVDTWGAAAFGGAPPIAIVAGPGAPGEVLEEVGRALDRREAERAVEREASRATPRKARR